MWKIKPVFGGSVYGLNVYGQYREMDLILTENLIEGEAIIIKIREKNGFLKYAYHSNTGVGYPFSRIKIGWIGKSPSDIEFELVEHPSKRRYEIMFGDIIEIYIYSDSVPYWSGIITSSPEGISENKRYSYKGTGLKKRIESCFIDTKSTSSVNISSFVNTQITTTLTSQVPQLKYNAAKIESVSASLINYDFTRKKASDAFNKIQEIAGNCEWGADPEREFYFYEKSTALDNRHVYFSGINAPDVEISETDYSKIENKYFVEIKKAGAAGTSYYTTLNQVASQSKYGIYAKNLQMPEATVNTIANTYATNMLEIKSFPSFKGSVKNVPFFKTARNWTNKFLDGSGFARVFTAEQYNLETVNNLENLAQLYTSSTTHLPISLNQNFLVSGDYSLRADATTSATSSYIKLTLPQSQDWESVQEISFWLRSSRAGANIQFGFGSTAYSTNLFNFFIGSANTWEKITIDTTSTGLIGDLTNINYLGWKITDATSDNTFYVDNIQKYEYGRKYFDLEIVKAELILEPNKDVFNLELETIDWPFSADFAEAWRNIEALKQATKGA